MWYVIGRNLEAFFIFQLIENLRDIEASKFATTMEINPNKMETVIGPRIDYDFLPKPINLLRAEAPSKLALVGTCQYEGLIFCRF